MDMTGDLKLAAGQIPRSLPITGDRKDHGELQFEPRSATRTDAIIGSVIEGAAWVRQSRDARCGCRWDVSRGNFQKR